MKKTIITLWALVVLASCAGVPNDDEAKTIVTNAYEKFFSQANSEVYNIDMKEFVTEEFDTQLSLCASKQSATDDLFFDYDFWINAQDAQDLKLNDVKVTDCNAQTATCEVSFQNMGSECKAILIVKKTSNGKWLIDDFIDPTDKTSLRKAMDNYLKN